MGVMNCARNGCENIMCDRYSTTHGYICDECFEELIAHGPQQDVAEFMESWRDADVVYDDGARQKFEEEFTSR